MRCDVLAVGTELLLGQIVDTNSAWIGETLARDGIDSLLQVKVGDNTDRIAAALGSLVAGADAVIVSGGLGPTHDDVTRDAIAAVMGVELAHDADVAAVVTDWFARRNRPMPENNLRQAMVPLGATVIPQTQGTAPGLVCPIDVDGRTCVVYAVPGVPHEMRDMVTRAVIPDLLARDGSASKIVSRTLHTWGDGESRLAERLEGIVDELDRRSGAGEPVPTLAFLARGGDGLDVRLTAKATTLAECEAVISPWKTAICDIVGEQLFGVDDDTIEGVVLGLCQERGLTLGLAESVTGGLIGGRLTAVPGASAVLRGAVVSYASDVKFGLLGVARGPVVSDTAARQMAVGVRRLLGADIGLAVTGVAGPDTQDGMPVGTLFVAVVGPGFDAVLEAHLPPVREQMRQFAVITALDLLRRQLR